MNLDFWRDSTILITGGTGSFGRAFLRECSSIVDHVREIRIFSRDEKKQDDMKHQFSHPKINYVIGDVRDADAVDAAMVGVDFVFHAAALKHVPTGEYHPYETVKTNVIGSNNVIDSAIRHGAKKVVVLSTDKAVEPTCAMGMTKGLMEKCALARCEASQTAICVTRFGNVMGSRNSVIPLFAEQLRNGEVATVTDPGMVRYMMTMDEAQQLVIYAFENGKTGDTLVLHEPVANVLTVLTAVRDIVAPAALPINDRMIVLGARRGEKKKEELLNAEEKASAYRVDADFGEVYCIPYHRVAGTSDYPSEDRMLSAAELKQLILDHHIIEEV